MKTYCLHHADSVDRKEILLKVFAHQKMDVEWMEKFHPKGADFDRSKLDVRYPLKDDHISLYLKHKWVYEQQKEHGYENVLILENDVIIPEDLNFNQYLDECMAEFKELNGDIMFVGGGLNIVPPHIVPNKKVYCEPGFRSRMSHCYVVNIKAVDKILKHINIINQDIDWKLNFIIADEQLRCCYVEPCIYQATVVGTMKSSLQW